MEKKNELPPRLWVNDVTFGGDIGYTLAFPSQDKMKHPQIRASIEYISLEEHNAITKLASETIEHWKSKAEGWQKDVAKLEGKLEVAKDCLEKTKNKVREMKYWNQLDFELIDDVWNKCTNIINEALEKIGEGNGKE